MCERSVFLTKERKCTRTPLTSFKLADVSSKQSDSGRRARKPGSASGQVKGADGRQIKREKRENEGEG